MADRKYVAANVHVNTAHLELIDKACATLHEELGVKLSRSETLAVLAKRYLDTQSLTAPTGATAWVPNK